MLSHLFSSLSGIAIGIVVLLIIILIIVSLVIIVIVYYKNKKNIQIKNESGKEKLMK